VWHGESWSVAVATGTVRLGSCHGDWHGETRKVPLATGTVRLGRCVWRLAQ
jgi:hypothetical protein